jgi:hypothetical protein
VSRAYFVDGDPEEQAQIQAVHRAGWRRRQARKRARWDAQGRCTGCGGDRVPGRKQCALCLVGTVIRVERCLFRKREGR